MQIGEYDENEVKLTQIADFKSGNMYKAYIYYVDIHMIIWGYGTNITNAHIEKQLSAAFVK